MKYIAVTPAKDESKFIGNSVTSVLRQTIPPHHYVVVDDGSLNGTPEIVEKLGVSCIKINTPRMTRGMNQAYGAMFGVETITKVCGDWDYVLNLDADSLIPPEYVEVLIERMMFNPRLGICAGQPKGENIRLSRVTNGARLIRRECWDQIGGYHILNAFDSHQVLKARQAGWITRTFRDVKYTELRRSKKRSMKRWMYAGMMRKELYFPLYHTIFAALRNVTRGHPPILNSIIIVLSHIIHRPKKHVPYLNKDWVRKFAIYEIRHFWGELFH